MRGSARLLPLVAAILLALGRMATAAPVRRTSADLDRDTLAWVGGDAITARDLVARIELMPWPLKSGEGGIDSAKVRALQSLAGESLLAQEARRQRLDQRPEFARMRASLERALARDALYRELAAEAAPPTADEIDRAVHALPPGAGPAARRAARHAAADSLRQLAGRIRAARFMGGFLAKQRVVVDPATFTMLADSLHRVAGRSGEAGGGGPFRIPETAPDAMLSVLRGSLERPLADLPGGPLTLGEAIEDLRLYPFVFHGLEPRRFAFDLNQHLKTIVEGELLAREAMRRGLHRRPEVRRELDRWTDAWVAQLLLERTVAAAPRGETPATAVARRIARLAEQSRVEFDYSAAREVEITEHNMVTRRMLGFGGGMLAAPNLTPLWDWVPIWRAASHPLP